MFLLFIEIYKRNTIYEIDLERRRIRDLLGVGGDWLGY